MLGEDEDKEEEEDAKELFYRFDILSHSVVSFQLNVSLFNNARIKCHDQ